MPVYKLTKELVFPPPGMADEDGLLAVGGDLSVDRLVLAYSMGIFPWYSDNYPILWWSPDPRLILLPKELKISRSLGQTIKKGIYRITVDTAFEEVINNCASIRRKDENSTWITDDMIQAYIRLHRAGFAHSVEAWEGNELAGGLYGVILGKAFFGESMFARKSDASKTAFAIFAKQLAADGFHLIDCQISTAHMRRFGAREVSRAKFLRLLELALT